MQISKSGKTLTILIFILIVFGLVMLSSAGVVEGQKRFGSASYYFTHQLLYGVLPGLALFFLFSKINYKFWKKIALPLLIVAVGLMVLVFVPGVGYGLRGANRWLNFGFFTFQPSELLKLTLIIYLAAWFSRRDRQIGGSPQSLVPFLLVLGFIGLLLISQPDMGTLILVTLIAISMYFFAGAKFTHFVVLFLIVGIMLGALSVVEPYRFDRLKAFLNPSSDQRDTSYHINQALMGIGSGGIFGLGFGQSRQKINNFLPEPVGDSIFAIVVEELGLVGGIFLLVLFLVLSLAMINIAKSAANQFGGILVLGIIVWICGQALINIFAISGLIPLTGLPLPFISFGSSSLVSILAGLGIVVNISKHSS
ncbi:MAG: putative lipid II flippase FtsW [Candidatus Yanofskybacteria bacterium]|nr:putative lipid II flippase FtsW [Candidatus Yanofskybacteria bacterium]